MIIKEKVYHAFAELIYAVLMADGKISELEKKAIFEITKGHPIESELQNYFNSNLTDISIAQSFLNTFEVCKQQGDDSEYAYLFKLVHEVAGQSEGLNNDEDNLLRQFINSFRIRFLV